MVRASHLLIPLLLLAAGCAPAAPPSRANAAQVTACKARGEATYALQNRAEIYTPADAQPGLTSLSGTGAQNSTERNLGETFGRDRDYAACLHDSGTAP
jgi:hypothetical protein